MRFTFNPVVSKPTPVQRDWRAWLTTDKSQVFSSYVDSLESSYAILSISLNEAMDLRDSNRAVLARQAMSVAASLCDRLVQALEALLHALGEHAKHYGTMPNAAPLNPANFQGVKQQRTAKMNDLLSRVLLTQRSQFLHKITTLEEMVADIAGDFVAAAQTLANGASAGRDSLWKVADDGHYDINTCLREAVILFKSFLMALPEDQLGEFQKTVSSQMQSSKPKTTTSVSAHVPKSTQSVVRHGRMSLIAGE